MELAWRVAGAHYAVVALPFVGWVGGFLVFFALGRGALVPDLPAVGLGAARRGRPLRLDVGYATRRRLHVSAGAGALYAAPWLARGVAAVQVAMARLLLEPGERERLTARVDTLEETRAGMVAAADAERRRIERDLHDGAQQRLVALAMTLGRAKVTEDPELARRLVDEAHGEAKEALVELRNLARGIHPGGADRPRAGRRRLRARRALPDAGRGRRRPPAPRQPGTEAIAYFVVAEALTNVAKHAEATRAWLTAEFQGDRLVVEVLDNGRGGAIPTGVGMAGLRDRVRAVDGDLHPVQPARRRDDPASGAAMRAVIAEDAVLLREGLARLLDEGGFEVVDCRRQRRGAAARGRAPPARRLRRRRADAADVQRRGRQGRARDPQAVAGRVAADALPVRRGALRRRPDRRRQPRHRVPAQGPRGRRGRLPGGARRVAAGGAALDPEVVTQLLVRSGRKDPLDPLSPREREVLELMAEGRTNGSIAGHLVVTEGAVEKHVTNIFIKLGLPPADQAHRRVLAVLRYLEHGATTNDARAPTASSRCSSAACCP